MVEKKPFIKRVVSYPIEENCWLFGDREKREIVAIDPGNSSQIAEQIEKFGGELVAICCTHSHFDHVEGNKLLKERFSAPIMIGKYDAPYLTESYKSAELFGVKSVASPPADRLLVEGDKIKVGRYTLEVIEYPGHTPGLIAFYERWLGLLFAGDLIFYEGIGRFDLPRGDFQKTKESLHKLMRLPDEVTIFTGHGEKTTVAHERMHNPFREHFL